MVKSTACEINRGNVWKEIDVTEAIEIRKGLLMRCPDCHGRVQAHRQGENAMQAHFEHRKGYEGCR